MSMATRVALGHDVSDQAGNYHGVVIEGNEFDGKSSFWMGSFAAQALEEKKILVGGVLTTWVEMYNWCRYIDTTRSLYR